MNVEPMTNVYLRTVWLVIVVIQDTFLFPLPQHNGDLGGLSGADGICQGLAEAAGLPGTYQAWLSVSTAGPARRFTYKSRDYYTLVDSTLVAKDWGDLTDNKLTHPINMDENGVKRIKLVWTNTTGTGTQDTTPPPVDCNGWAVDAESTNGRLGYSANTFFDWTIFALM